MAIERTLSIIKPDATRRNLTGQINARLEAAGLRIVGQKRKQLTEAEAKAFYAVHAERPFYDALVAFMTSGPVVLQVLEGENAVATNREVMGATNPADAADGKSAKTLLNQSRRIRCMGQIAQKMRPSKSAISLLDVKSHHNARPACHCSKQMNIMIKKAGLSRLLLSIAAGFIPAWQP